MMELKTISVEDIIFNPDNPRQSVLDEELKELSLSLKRDGLIEPIVVRSQGIKYEIVVGERRVRAAILADIPRLPAIIRDDLDEEDVSRLRLIENLARKDLNVFERVNGIKSHMTKFHLNWDQIAEALNKKPNTIKSWFRLAETTSPNIQTSDEYVRLLGTQKLMEISKYNFETQESFAEHIVKNELTVDQIRRLVTLFESNPDADVNLLIKKVKEQVKTIEVTLPVDEAKQVLKRAREIREKEKKAEKKLKKHIRQKKESKKPSPKDKEPSSQTTEPKLSPVFTPLSSQSSAQVPVDNSVSSVKVPVTLPNLKKIRDTELAKLANEERFSAAEISRLKELNRDFPDTPPRDLVQIVLNELRPRIMVIEIPPNIYTALESFSNASKIFPKEGVMLLIEEGLAIHGYITGGR